MKHFTKMITALLLLMLGVTSVSAQESRVPLSADMWKQWDGVMGDAQVTGNLDGVLRLGENLAGGATLFGSGAGSVVWTQYADITGYKRIEFRGTPGTRVRFMLNRIVDEGRYVQKIIAIGDDGNGVLDLTTGMGDMSDGSTEVLDFVHLNCIKLPDGGLVSKMVLIKDPDKLTADMFLHWDGVYADAKVDTAEWKARTDSVVNPVANFGVELAGGATVWGDANGMVRFHEYADLSKYSKILFKATPGKEVRFMFNRIVDEGKYVQKIVKADADGNGVVDLREGMGDMTDNSKEPLNFVHLNSIKIPWGATETTVSEILLLEEEAKSLVNQVVVKNDIMRIDLGYPIDTENIPEDGLLIPTEAFNVTVNGQAATLLSAEVRKDGKFFVFLDDPYPTSSAEPVFVSFTNPAEAPNIKFKDEDAPAGADITFDGVMASWNDDIEDVHSWVIEMPKLVEANPEDGSFNLPNTLQDFVLTFNKAVDTSLIKATFDGEALSVTPANDENSTIKFSRSTADAVSDGAHTLLITDIFPAINYIYEDGDKYELTLGFGKVKGDPSDTVKVVMTDGFAESGANTVAPGWIVASDDELRTTGNNYSGGCRIIAKNNGDLPIGLYLSSRGRTDRHDGEKPGFASYGEIAEKPLTLTPGKYELSFMATRWDRDEGSIRVKIFDPDSEIIAEELYPLDKAPRADQTTVGAPTFTVKVKVEKEGNYVMKFYPGLNNGEPGGYNDPIYFGNVKFTYLPSTPGAAEMFAVEQAIKNAKACLAANDSDRYDGIDKETLKAALAKYEGVEFTSPAKCTEAVKELEAGITALNDHRKLCDDFDALPAKGQEIIDKFAGTKFEVLKSYTDLVAAVAQYAPLKPVDNNELKAGIEAMTKGINIANGMFTEGESKCNMTGIATLIEGIRLGAEAALKLGASEEESYIIAAKKALDDNDALRGKIQKNLRKLVYTELAKTGENKFTPTIDEITYETIQPSYEMTVFVKNPNIYNNSGTTNIDGVPGWNHNANAGWTHGWSQNINADVPAGDGMFQTWNSEITVDQTITGLPVGIYDIVLSFGERQDDGMDAANPSLSWIRNGEALAKMEQGDTTYTDSIHAKVIGQSYPVNNVTYKDVEIKDGKLALGIYGNPKSHTFFNQVKLFIKGPVEGFDYAKAAEEEATIEGDINGDDQVNGTDLVVLANMVLGQTDKTPAADINADGEVNGTDLVALANIVLSSEAPAYKMAPAQAADGAAALSIEGFNIEAGGTAEMKIDLTNPNDDITLVQFDMYLPAGLSISKDGDEYEVDLARTSYKKHSLDLGTSFDDFTRFLLWSSKNNVLDGNSGTIITVKLKADATFNGGTIQLKKILLVTPDEKETKCDLYEYTIGTDGIRGITASDDVTVDGPVFNLAGQRLQTPQKGINIIGGKKVIVK